MRAESPKMVEWEKTCTIRYREVPYSRSDLDNSWYSEQEILAFRAERVQIKDLVRELGSIELADKALGDQCCCRGLEKFASRRQSQQRRQRILDATAAVQDAQTTQRFLRSRNPDVAIAKEYQRISRVCQQEANISALMNLAKDSHDDSLSVSKKELERRHRSKSPGLLSRTRVTTAPVNAALPERM